MDKARCGTMDTRARCGTMDTCGTAASQVQDVTVLTWAQRATTIPPSMKRHRARPQRASLCHHDPSGMG